MRRFETNCTEPEFPCRYYFDEPRFSGGRELLRNEEAMNDGPTSAERE